MLYYGNDAKSGAAPIVGNTAVTLNLMISALVTAGS
jgi:hypothetical protein